MRDNRPDEWADAVDFDRRVRERSFKGPNQVPYLRRSLLPLDQAPIDRRTGGERRADNATGSLLDLIDLDEDGDPDGCSPFGCRSGLAVE
jgi:hypothetical protein